ncbi:MAG: hypothetical protein ACYYK0_02040 [Candidatus Eutrophobiaceae bacterium]
MSRRSDPALLSNSLCCSCCCRFWLAKFHIDLLVRPDGSAGWHPPPRSGHYLCGRLYLSPEPLTTAIIPKH